MIARLHKFILKHKTLRNVLIFCGVWGIIVGLFTLHLQTTPDVSAYNAFVKTIALWSPWIVLAPFIFSLTTRYPLTPPERLTKNVAIHLIASIIVAFTAELFLEIVAKPLQTKFSEQQKSHDNQPGTPFHFGDRRPHPGDRPPPPGSRPEGHPPHATHLPPPSGSLLSRGVQHLPRTIPTYWTLMGIQSVLIFGNQLRKRERQALELKAKLTQSQLDTLKLQLQPHFLFNALNAISTLLHEEPKVADQMIGNLSTLLRGVLDAKDSNQLILSQELELLDAYMNIEHMRYGDRVQFHSEVMSECLSAKVPTLILQPIVENAVRHGLEPLDKPGDIWLSAQKVEQRLRIKVEDNGVGRGTSKSQGWGLGISNAEARLEALYGNQGYSLSLTDRKGGGTSVTIEMPFEMKTS